MTTPAGRIDGDRQWRTEPNRVNIRALYLFAVTLAILLILIQPIVGRLLRDFQGRRPVESFTSTLQTAHWLLPGAELETTRRREDRNINSYGWIDRQNGIVRIPVVRAMELMVRNGDSGDQYWPGRANVEKPPAPEQPTNP